MLLSLCLFHRLGNGDTGIIASPKFNHSDFCWFSRLLPGVKKAFASIWSTNDLIVSFDAGNAFRPWDIHPGWVTSRNWWHVDQNSKRGQARHGKVCVQGLVTYYDVTERTGGLCLFPGSQSEHDTLCSRCPSADTKRDFVYLETTDPIITENQAILPLAKAGDLILWDSRVVHCNTPGLTSDVPLSSYEPGEEERTDGGRRKRITMSKEEIYEKVEKYRNGALATSIGESEGVEKVRDVELLRLVSYVCMLPRGSNPAYCTDENTTGNMSEYDREMILDAKKKGFLSRTPTSHWATEKIVFYMEEDEANTNREGGWRNMNECSDEMLRLAGFSEKEIMKKKYIPYSSSKGKCTIA